MFVVVGLLALSIVMIAVAAAAQRSASRAHADLERTTRFDCSPGCPTGPSSPPSSTPGWAGSVVMARPEAARVR